MTRGHICPICNSPAAFVYKTRRPSRGLVVRYRACRNPDCKSRFTTKEIPGRVIRPPEKPPEGNSGYSPIPSA